jgi:hypothetical protein
METQSSRLRVGSGRQVACCRSEDECRSWICSISAASAHAGRRAALPYSLGSSLCHSPPARCDFTWPSASERSAARILHKRNSTAAPPTVSSVPAIARPVIRSPKSAAETGSRMTGLTDIKVAATPCGAWDCA